MNLVVWILRNWFYLRVKRFPFTWHSFLTKSPQIFCGDLGKRYIDEIVLLKPVRGPLSLRMDEGLQFSEVGHLYSPRVHLII